MTAVHVKWSELAAQRVGQFVATPRHQRRAIAAFIVVTLWQAGLHLAAATLAVYLFGRRSHLRAGRRIAKRYRGARGQKGKGVVRAARVTRAAYVATRPEVAVTKLMRRQKWFEHMCEVRNITPAPKVTGFEKVDDGTKTTLRLNGAGMTVDMLRRYIPGIKLYIGRGVIDVRIAEHPTDPETAFMYVVTKDLLKESLGPWPMLHDAPGSRSIADGILIGRDNANHDIRVDATIEVMFAGGQRGMGKSSYCHQVVAGVALCHDAELIIWDMREGAEFFMYEGRVREFIDTPEGALASAKRLHALRKERGAYLRAKGMKKWQPGCGLPFIFLVVDEVAECDDGSKPGPTQALLTQIIRLGRGAGIGGLLATQRPTADYIDTSLRAQCGIGISFKARPGDEQVTLGPGAKGLGLNPATLPPHQFIGLGGPFPDGGRGRGWWLSDAEVEQFVGKLPPVEQTASSDLSTFDTIGHENRHYIEPPLSAWPPPSNPPPPVPVRTPDPPAECARSKRARALWEALPGESAALVEASDFTRQRVHQLLTKWDSEGLVMLVGNEWRHRDPADIDRIMA
jgi:hypothetical protein